MVATTDRYASDVGVAVLRSGGNSVDAAVAVSFALAVVNPEAGNLGGSGFLVVRKADGEVAALDFRSKAPLTATRDMFVDPDGEATDRSLVGHLAAGVPGSVRGLWEAHRHHGSLPWASLVEPAIGLATGFVVGDRFVRSLLPRVVSELDRFPSSRAVFLTRGRPPRAGETLRQPDLAATLERIRDGGPDGFYQGITADRIVAEMRRGGGLLSHEDLAAYEAVWREPLSIRYRDHTLLTMPPPSSGGVTIALTCHMLDRLPLSAHHWNGAQHLHLLVEAWRRAFSDQNHWLGDPDRVTVPTARLVSPEYGELRGRGMPLDRATPSTGVQPGSVHPPHEGDHTTHVSIVGPEGDTAAVTTTLNTWYGGKLVAEGTGVLLNSDMDDFTLAPGVPNYFGLNQGEANAIEPAKRMLSAMTPTIVLGPEEDRPLRLVLGTSGGPRIATTLFQVLSNIVDHGMDPASAVSAPRVHHQHLPDEVLHEPAGLSDQAAEGLRGMGHRVVERDEVWGDVQAVAVGERGILHGVSDPRRGGEPAGF